MPLEAEGPPPNKRSKLSGAIVLMETVESCPSEHGNFVHYPLRRWASRPQLKRDRLDSENYPLMRAFR